MIIKTIGVCGAGTMGRGIAQVCATAGFSTILYEPIPTVLQNATEALRLSLNTLVQKGKLTNAASEEILGRIVFTQNLNDCKADLVIEAIVEVPEIKVQLFGEMAAINPPQTIFASNTSSLSITALAQNIVHPERFAGLHFFNPAPLMKLVEVVAGKQTNPEVLETLEHLVAQLGKTAVACKDAPGFIVNRVARLFYIEALRQAETGVDIECIDRLMEARGFKMGPFKLMDLIGNDVNYAVSCSVYEQLGQPERLRPSPLQQQKVAIGDLGKKTGRGYYDYSSTK